MEPILSSSPPHFPSFGGLSVGVSGCRSNLLLGFLDPQDSLRGSVKKRERQVKYKKPDWQKCRTEAIRTGGLFKAAGEGEVYLFSELMALKVIQISVRAEAISGTGQGSREWYQKGLWAPPLAQGHFRVGTGQACAPGAGCGGAVRGGGGERGARLEQCWLPARSWEWETEELGGKRRD